MIRFKVGANLYEFQGTITPSIKTKYLSEKKDPYNPSLFYRFGKYYQDTLDILIIATPGEYETFFYDVSSSGTFIVAWETITGYQSRRVSDQILPYPSAIRFISEGVQLSLESEPYLEIIKEMPDITRNTIWNHSTINNTNWS